MNKIPYQARREIYEAAIAKNGMDVQMLVAIEEMSEVVKALTKLMRINDPQRQVDEYLACLDDLAEEIADATIMLEQLRYFLGLNNEVCEAMDKKIERLRERVAE